MIILTLSLAIMMSIQPVLSVIAIALSAPPVLIPGIWGKSLSGTTEIYAERLGGYHRIVDDIFQGIEAVRNFELELGRAAAERLRL